jgi:hypothetical protein
MLFCHIEFARPDEYPFGQAKYLVLASSGSLLHRNDNGGTHDQYILKFSNFQILKFFIFSQLFSRAGRLQIVNRKRP